MMKIEHVDRLSRTYAKQELWLTAGIFLLVLGVMSVSNIEGLLVPAIVGAVFSLVVSTAEALIWRRVAKPDNLPTFYTAASGFRLLLALATMFVYYLVKGRDAMLVFFIVFMIFYLVLLAHTSVYFARLSNRS